jgi:iron complex outermembrane receptor protein
MLSTATALAQADTTLLLPEAVVSGQQLRTDFVGQSTTRWDSADMSRHVAQSLPDLLERETGVFVKSYGLGSSATTSIRGGSAGHTAVTWNGLPLQSPMLGQLDFSLMPMLFVDEVSLQRGGNTASWGSGAVGGTIGLETAPLSYDGLEASIQTVLGSFGRWDQQMGVKLKSGKWGFNTRLFHREAQNDFTYELTNGNRRAQTNAAFRQQGILQEAYWQPNDQHQLSLSAWWQTTERELPPTTTQNLSLASQRDSTLRTALRWRYLGRKSVWNLRLGWFWEAIDFRDDLIRLRALSHFHTLVGEIEGAWQFGEGTAVQAGLFYNYNIALADGYGDTQPEQQQQAIFASIRQVWGKWSLQASARQAGFDGALVPFVPALGVEMQALDWLVLKGSMRRNFRLPTLNDLYWNPGGNPDLQPEEGWSMEGGFELSLPAVKGHFRYSATAFDRWVDNWILWGVSEGQNFFSANNLTEVHSRGLEQRISWSWKADDWSLQLSGGYDYIRSTNEVAIEQPRLAAGEPLAYTPEHQGFALLELGCRKLQLSYQHRWVGEVRTLNKNWLPGYEVAYCQGRYPLYWKDWRLDLFARADNLWGTSYRILEGRPMPGRNYQMGVNLFFKHSK